MFNNFFGKPDPKDEQRKADRQLRKVGRELERDRQTLDKEEAKLEAEIRKLAKEGNNEACKVLAKQLIQLRKQKTRSYAASSKVQGIGLQNKTMGASVKMADAMGIASKTMHNMNVILKPEQIAATMNNFSKESMKMDMTDEMINDSLDDIMNDSGDEQETDDVVNRVLDEIGIEISGKMSKAPMPSREAIVSETDKNKPIKLTDSDIEAQLARLKEM